MVQLAEVLPIMAKGKREKKTSQTIRVSEQAYEILDLLASLRKTTVNDIIESLLDTGSVKMEIGKAKKLEEERKKLLGELDKK